MQGQTVESTKTPEFSKSDINWEIVFKNVPSEYFSLIREKLHFDPGANDIHVASKEGIKPNVVREVFGKLFEDFDDTTFNIIGHSEAKSEISEQPVGFDETLKGAVNREKSMEIFGTKTKWLSIESGIFPRSKGTPKRAENLANAKEEKTEDNYKGFIFSPNSNNLDRSQNYHKGEQYFDAAVIVIGMNDKIYVTVSPELTFVDFPIDAADEAFERGFEHTVVGHVIAEKNPNVNRQDPQGWLTDYKMNRKTQLAITLIHGLHFVASNESISD